MDDFKYEIKYFCNISLDQLTDLNLFINKELAIAGVITDVQHRTAKNGKGWASFIIEDYNGSYEFRLFNEDYLKFRNYLIPNGFVYARFQVREGWQQKDSNRKPEPRIQFTHIMQLQDVMDQYAKKITLHLNVHEINNDLISSLHNLINEHQGSESISFLIMKEGDKTHLDMTNNKLKVDISSQFLHHLEEQSIRYKLN